MQIEILIRISYFQVLENFLHVILNVRQFILVLVEFSEIFTMEPLFRDGKRKCLKSCLTRFLAKSHNDSHPLCGQSGFEC